MRFMQSQDSVLTKAFTSSLWYCFDSTFQNVFWQFCACSLKGWCFSCCLTEHTCTRSRAAASPCMSQPSMFCSALRAPVFSPLRSLRMAVSCRLGGVSWRHPGSRTASPLVLHLMPSANPKLTGDSFWSVLQKGPKRCHEGGMLHTKQAWKRNDQSIEQVVLKILLP